MEKLYLGVELHKRSCWVTVLDADGYVVESGRIGTTKPELLEFFGKVQKPAAPVSAVPRFSSAHAPLASSIERMLWVDRPS